jgi:molybdopterin synthase catalytic subunit
MGIEARLERERFDPAVELKKLIAAATDEGAVVSFVGIARPRTKDDNEVERLVLEHHPRLTAKSLQDIALEGARRFGASDVRIVHRCGEIAPGEPIVFAGAASAHRRAAFEAADYLMDRLKTEAVFWKREESSTGLIWIEPTDDDYADRARWE